ncbi:hypothetical protein Tco_0565569 [Tanacetum coccineum]
MHIRNDPSFFLTNRTGAPQGEELVLIKPLSDSSCSCFDNSFILEGAKMIQVSVGQVAQNGPYPRSNVESGIILHGPLPLPLVEHLSLPTSIGFTMVVVVLQLGTFPLEVSLGSTLKTKIAPTRCSASCFGGVVVVVGYYLAFSCSLSDSQQNSSASVAASVRDCRQHLCNHGRLTVADQSVLLLTSYAGPRVISYPLEVLVWCGERMMGGGVVSEWKVRDAGPALSQILARDKQPAIRTTSDGMVSGIVLGSSGEERYLGHKLVYGKAGTSKLLAITRYAGCGGGVAADSLVIERFVSSQLKADQQTV